MAVALAALLLILGPLAAGSTKGPAIVASEVPEMKVDADGNATATITLRAVGGKRASGKLKLTLSDFEHTPAVGKSYPLRTSYSFTPVRPQDKPLIEGTRNWNGRDVSFDLKVSKLWEAGVSTAVLKNDGQDVATDDKGGRCILTAVRVPAAYNVQLLPLVPGSEEIALRGAPLSGLIRLRNSDPMNYDFNWKMRLCDEIVEGAYPIRVPASGETELTLSLDASKSPSCAGWLLAGSLKSDIVAGDLILTPVVPDQRAAKVLPTTFRLSHYPATQQQILNGLLLFLVLFAGGTFSIWTRFGIPNTIKTSTLKQRLRICRSKIRGMSHEIDSQYRRTLDSLLETVRADLRSTFRIFPSSAERIDQIEGRVELLAAWVTVAYDVASLLHRAEALKTTAPPTIVRWIKRKCHDALFPIQSGFTTPEEMETMTGDVKAASDYLEALENRRPIPELEKEIKERETRLKPRIDLLWRTYPDSFWGLIETFNGIADTPLLVDDYFLRDGLSLRVNALDELRVLEGLARPTQVAAPATGPFPVPAAYAVTGAPVVIEGAYDRLQRNKIRLFDYLRAETHESLYLACCLLTEIRQDIYPNKLQAHLEDGNGARPMIVIDPSPIKAQEPVRLALRFTNGLLNEAAARNEWNCVWQFDNGEDGESGWEVYQVYKNAGEHQVSVAINDLDGHPVLNDPITRAINVMPSDRGKQPGRRFLPEWTRLESITKIEFVRLGVLLAITVFGLMATAQAQIEKLSFFGALGAAFAVGFAADMVKGAITPKPSGN